MEKKEKKENLENLKNLPVVFLGRSYVVLRPKAEESHRVRRGFF